MGNNMYENDNKDNSGTVLKVVLITVLVIATVICVGIGVMVHIFRNFRVEGNKGFISKYVTAANYSLKTESFDDRIEDFENIKLNLPMGDVDIKYGDEYRLAYELPESMVPSYHMDGDTLVVECKNKVNNFPLNVNSRKIFVTITVPRGEYKPGNLDVNLSLGDIDFSGIDFENIYIDANMGDIEFDGVNTRNVEIDADMGKVTLTDIEASSVSVDANMGDAVIKGSAIGKVNINCDMGNVELIRIDSDNVEVNCNAGNIEVDGKVKEIAAECDMGNIEFDSELDIDDVIMDLHCDMGDIKINGDDHGNSFKKH